jgi:outer membrane protein assembly factor BamC
LKHTRFRSGLCLLVAAALTVTGGCGWMGRHFVDRSVEYLEAEDGRPLRLPQGVNEAAIEDLLVIPDLPPQPQAEMFARSAPRPTSLFAPEQEMIKIQMLGDERWLVIPQPPALVWPQLKSFFMESGVPIGFEAPGEGRLDTGWMELTPGLDRDPVRRALAQAKAEAGLDGGRDRLRVQLEQGLRASSSEVIIRHEHDGAEVAVQVADPRDLRGQPTASAVDMELLNAVGTYVAANVHEPAFSLQAAALAARGRAEITHGADGHPVLRLDLDFDRAWATVRQALADADIEVNDLDRSQGLFYLEVREHELTGEENRRFLGRFRRQDPPKDVRLRMTSSERGYEVALLRDDGTPFDRDVSQTFLTMLREFAT